MTIIDQTPEPPSSLPPPAASRPGVTRSQIVIAWLVLALGLVLVLVGTSPFWSPALTPALPWGKQPAATSIDTGTTAQLRTQLESDEAASSLQATRLARLEADVASLKQQLSQLDDIQGTLRDQAARLSQLEARPTAAQAPSSAPPTQSPETAAAIKTLQDQVTKLSASASATTDQIAKLEAAMQKAAAVNAADRTSLLALANLRVAIESSAPFTGELAAVQALAGNDAAMREALASLDGAAKTGLPTTATLADRFDHVVAPAILRAPRDDAGAGWWQQIKARVARLVVIRRVGPGGAEPRDATDAAVAKVDAALKTGDLAAAVAALDNLSGAQAKAAATWLALAKQRVAAETTLAKLWQDQTAKAEAKP